MTGKPRKGVVDRRAVREAIVWPTAGRVIRSAVSVMIWEAGTSGIGVESALSRKGYSLKWIQDS